MTCRPLRRVASILLCVALLTVGCTGPEAADDVASEPPESIERNVNLAFYAHYPPVSSSADSHLGTAGFDQHLGYEADLLDAVEAMPGFGLTFQRRGIDDWADIWLLPAADGIDIACGGITIDPQRTRGPDGEPAVRFTDGHIEFRQSLLVRAADADRLAAYESLDGGDAVGVQTATTGESRLLQLIGAADEHGRLAERTRVMIEAGDGSGDQHTVEATGANSLWINPGGSSAELAGRVRLIPPDPSKPEVVYLDRLGASGLDTADTSESQLEALRNGTVDAIAQGIVETTATAAASGDELVVSVVDRQVEIGGCTVAADDADLADRMNRALRWLTDDGSVGFADWVDDPDVFAERAASWAEANPAPETGS